VVIRQPEHTDSGRDLGPDSGPNLELLSADSRGRG
jgi:hypothetical protein